MSCDIFISLFENSHAGGPVHLKINLISLKDTHGQKAPSNEIPTLSESMNMDIWVVLKLKQNFRKNKVVTGKTPFFLIGPFYNPLSISLNIGF